MGAVTAPCSSVGNARGHSGTISVESPVDEQEDLAVFDRSSLAQVKGGDVHKNYEFLEELGSGSFGTVSKGRDIRSAAAGSGGNSVAIKTIPKKKVSDPKKIKAEFNVLRQLDHAHICKAYECYEDRRNIYLVMDICSGGTLLETLCKQVKFSEADCANVMRQILSALGYLHHSDFVFRDLKTENVMFASPPKTAAGNVKLIDFGLCCPFERGTKISKAAGTPYSVAPELVTAPVQYDQKCDAWSAGVVMYILLSGQYPFKGRTKDELLHNIRKEPVSFRDKRWKKVSREAKTLLAELLRKKVETRCEVIQALEHPWLQRDTALPDENLMAEVVASMTHFQSLNMLQKAAITALAWRATDDETRHLREIFESIDRDGNGFVTVEELHKAFEQAGVHLELADLSALAQASGTDGNDTIEYTEFIAAAMDKKNCLKEDVVWEAFKIFDQDGSGTVTKKELLKILTGRTSDKIRSVHGDKAIDNFLGEYDVSGDAVIDFEEFMGMLQAAADNSTTRVDSSRKTFRSTEVPVPGSGQPLVPLSTIAKIAAVCPGCCSEIPEVAQNEKASKSGRQSQRRPSAVKSDGRASRKSTSAQRR